MLNLIKVNTFIPITRLIIEIKSCWGYSVTYKKTWFAKQKALVMEFDD